MTFLGMILAALVVPYFTWGIYAMHRKFLRHHEWPMHVEAMSIAALLVYFALAIPVLRGYLSENTAALAFALLGLTASGFALYGHMAVSLTAKLVVDSITTSGDPGAHGPRLGPAQALERQRDYEGAYAEYLVLARIYPHDVQVKLRLAGVLKHLGKSAEAADWFEKALKKSTSREQSSIAAVRLAEIAERELADVPRARKALELYLAQFPATPDKKVIEERLQNLGTARVEQQQTGLVALDDVPLEQVPDDVESMEEPRVHLELVRDETPTVPPAAPDAPEEAESAATPMTLERLDENRGDGTRN